MNKLKAAAQRVADIANTPRNDNGTLYTAIDKLRDVLDEGSDDITVNIKVDSGDIAKAIEGARIVYVMPKNLDQIDADGFNMLYACVGVIGPYTKRMMLVELPE